MGKEEGVFVSVLGPDGSGKSTLIDRLQRELKEAFRQTAIFHLMPGLLRRRTNGAPVTDPHGKPPRSLFASLLKLLYYLLDYNLGFWLKVRPALARTTLVCFDRYYDDLLIDSKRYRYGGPMKLARWLRRFIPRPDLFLVLDVPVEKLLERKQEVTTEELRRQVEEYRAFALETPNAYLLDGSLPTEEVAREAREILLDHLHARYLARRHIWFPPESIKELDWLLQSLGIEISKDRPTHAWLRLPDGRGYLLPFANGSVFRRGMELYSAQGRKARLGKDVLDTLARLGIKGPGLARVRLKEQKASVFQTLRKVFGREDLSFAVSLGTPGPHRKPVIQVLTPQGKKVLCYAKVGWNEATQLLVKNEAEVLKRLNAEALPFKVPRVLYANESMGLSLCVQAPPPDGSRPAPRAWSQAYTDVLCALASRGVVRSPLEETDFWRGIVIRVEEVRHPYWKRILKEAIEKVRREWGCKKVPLHLAHGDFAPWNAFWAEGRLYLYDWEYTLEEAPAGYDLFHFWVQTLWLVDGRAPGEIGPLILQSQWNSKDKNYWSRVGVAKENLQRLLVLYLLERLSFYCLTNAREDQRRLFQTLLGPRRFLWI